jgi:hypothetical protein
VSRVRTAERQEITPRPEEPHQAVVPSVVRPCPAGGAGEAVGGQRAGESSSHDENDANRRRVDNARNPEHGRAGESEGEQQGHGRDDREGKPPPMGVTPGPLGRVPPVNQPEVGGKNAGGDKGAHQSETPGGPAGGGHRATEAPRGEGNHS